MGIDPDEDDRYAETAQWWRVAYAVIILAICVLIVYFIVT